MLINSNYFHYVKYDIYRKIGKMKSVIGLVSECITPYSNMLDSTLFDDSTCIHKENADLKTTRYFDSKDKPNYLFLYTTDEKGRYIVEIPSYVLYLKVSDYVTGLKIKHGQHTFNEVRCTNNTKLVNVKSEVISCVYKYNHKGIPKDTTHLYLQIDPRIDFTLYPKLISISVSNVRQLRYIPSTITNLSISGYRLNDRHLPDTLPTLDTLYIKCTFSRTKPLHRFKKLLESVKYLYVYCISFKDMFKYCKSLVEFHYYSPLMR